MSSANAAPRHPKRLPRWGLLVTALAAAIVASACLGSVPLDPGTVLGALSGTGDTDPVIRRIVLEFRLPRIATAVLAGAALATAGLLMQTVFRNPLADPFVLGVNSGASLGVALVLLSAPAIGIGVSASGGIGGRMQTLLAASAGAGAVLLLILALSRRLDVMSLLILGLMISYATGALVSILMFFSLADQLQAFVNWSFGDYGNVDWPAMRIFAPAVCGGLLLGGVCIKPLDALLLGPDYARSLGTNVARVRWVTLLAASLLAGAVTGFCGPIGFLGIAAPHLCRQLFRTGAHAVLLPASMLVGAFLSVASDLVARAPGLDVALPLNAITALIGAPVIIAALLRQRNFGRLFG